MALHLLLAAAYPNHCATEFLNQDVMKRCDSHETSQIKFEKKADVDIILPFIQAALRREEYKLRS